MTKGEFEQTLWALMLEQARFDRDKSQAQAAMAKSEQARAEAMTESVLKAIAEGEKANELPKFTS